MVFIKIHIVLCLVLVSLLVITFIIWRIKKKKRRDGYIERYVPNNKTQNRTDFKNRKGYISYKSDVRKNSNWFSESLDGLGVVGEFIKSIIEFFKGVGEIFEGFGGGGSGGHW